MKNKNSETLADFIEFCQQHPELRFWQALCCWANVAQIHIIDLKGIQKDTFFFKGKDENE